MTELDKIRSGSIEEDFNISISQDILSRRNSSTSRRSDILRPRHLRHRGIAYLWVAIFLLLFILLVGLTLDTAKVLLAAHQLQNAADAAALAGARVIKLDQADARDRAIAIALENTAYGDAVLLNLNEDNNPDGDIVVGRYDRSTQTFTPHTTAPNAMMVVARRTETSLGGPVPLTFGPIVSVDTSNVARYAIAMASGGTGAGIIALAPDGTGLSVKGNFTLDVNDGAMQVNSCNDKVATNIDGKPQFEAGELNVCGDPGIDATGGFDFPPDLPVNPNSPPIPDPLCPYHPPLTSPPYPSDCLQPPVWDPLADLSPSPGEPLTFDANLTDPNTGALVLEPGYYSGGFYLTGGDIILQPGIYILDGGDDGKGGLVVLGNTNFCAKGVMFYITGTGKVNIGGTGSVQVTPIQYDVNDFCDPNYSYPADTDFAYEDVSIFQARDNFNDAYIKGTGLMDLVGTLYFPSNLVNLRGEGDGFGNQLIAYRLDVRGTGDILIKYDGRNRSPANKSFLVE
jgi:Flp pilus assembly protein TadG